MEAAWGEPESVAPRDRVVLLLLLALLLLLLEGFLFELWIFSISAMSGNGSMPLRSYLHSR